MDECQTERTEEPEEFTEEYGDGEGAFQACIADEGEASDEGDDPVDEEPAGEPDSESA